MSKNPSVQARVVFPTICILYHSIVSSCSASTAVKHGRQQHSVGREQIREREERERDGDVVLYLISLQEQGNGVRSFLLQAWPG